MVLYFYPRDNTPGFTTEACDFRDSMNRLAPRCTVLGVSPDGPGSHKRFREKHGLNFPLLSDPDKRVATLYGAFGEKKMHGKVTRGIIRSTFLVDENGTVRKVWRKVKVNGHVDEVIGALSALECHMYVFKSLSEVREITHRWPEEYNGERPHESLGNLTPMEYLASQQTAENSNSDWY